MAQNITQPETQGIISTYKVIYKIFFVFGNFLVAGILAIGIWYALDVSTRGSTIESAEEASKSEIEGLPIVVDKFKIEEYQNTNTKKDSGFTSHWNAVTYEGYTFPAHIENKKIENLKKIEIFEKENYEVGDLWDAIKIVFHQSKKEINENLNIKDKTNTSPKDTVNWDVSCMKEKIKATNTVCKKVVDQQIEKLTAADLLHKSDIIYSVMSKLPKPTRLQLCRKTVDNARDLKEDLGSIEAIVDTYCGKEQQKKYKDIMKLIRANNDIHTKQGISGMGSDKVFNEYIMHSLLQRIYVTIQDGTIDHMTLKQYALSRNMILSQGYPVSQFTYDASYYINQRYLLPYLANRTKAKYLTEANIKEAQREIKKITKSATRSIESKVKNQKLIEEKGANNEEPTVPEEDDGKFLFEGKYYRQEKQETDSDGDIISYGSVKYENEELPISIHTSGTEVYKVMVEDKPDRSETITNLISQKKIKSLGEIEGFITRNRSTIQSDQIGMCDILSQKIEKELIQCSDSLVIVEKEMKKGSVRYEIGLDETKKINNIGISDAHMKKRVQAAGVDTDTNEYNVMQAIMAITNVTWNDESNETIRAGNKVLVIDRIKKYLDMEPVKIGQKGDDFLIELLIQKKQYYARYNTTKQSITDIILPDLRTDENKRVIVSDFSLKLHDDNRYNIDRFLADPISYIDRKHPYIKNIRNQQKKEN